jgi:hypothetical protein
MIGTLRNSAPLLVAALLVLGGCSSPNTKAPTCPTAGILAPVSTLTTFKEGKKDDPTAELYTVGLIAVHTGCDLDVDNGTTDSTLSIQFKARRTAATNVVENYRVPYFVAVVLDGKVLAKRNMWVKFGFAPGATETRFVDDVSSIVVNLENGKRPYDYELVSGLQLTHDQLEYNKKMSRFGL